ncbi:MAG TPA: response regulator [Casimicrobiaceae bacterium]|nr:response regulator [Casimicrobiaceae bacterium]
MAEEEPKLRGYVVLVVDDDADSRDAASGLIEALGCSTLAAGSCEEAIAVLDAGAHVDLVFSDVVMPKSTGVTLARLVRERDPSMPVVLATGYAEAVETATECGAIPLIKPYSMARLAAVLGEQLRVRGAPAV